MRIERVEGGRRFRQAGDGRHFAQGQLADVFTEIDLRGGAHAVGAVTQIDLVQIQLKDFILGEHLLDAHRQEGFLDFTHQGAFRA